MLFPPLRRLLPAVAGLAWSSAVLAAEPELDGGAGSSEQLEPSASHPPAASPTLAEERDPQAPSESEPREPRAEAAPFAEPAQPAVVPAASTAPAAPPTAAPPTPQAIVVDASGARRGAARANARSSEAVVVLKLDQAKRRSSDMGDLLGRTSGVSVQRSGGLGAFARFSLAGLYDDQIRRFVDGVPMELTGFPVQLADVPVALFERVVIYRGVLPLRLASDALGGAVELVTDERFETSAQASYQRSSFGTHRATLSGRYRHEPSGFTLGARGFFDITRNDYPVQVELPDDTGAERSVTVRRFHDHYRAHGESLDVGFVDRPWARRLTLRVFRGEYDAELQNNRTMDVPYGEVTYGERSYGAELRYAHTFRRGVRVESVLTHDRRRIDFLDVSDWVYDWRGVRLRRRNRPGEIETNDPHDDSLWDKAVFGRLFVEVPLTRGQLLHAATSPSFVTRTGLGRVRADPSARDPLTAERDLFTLTSGLEHELNAVPLERTGELAERNDHRLQNTAFAKSYLYVVRSEEPLAGGAFAQRDQTRHLLGVGDALRYTLWPGVFAKASYELTARLPRTDEVFGNGVLILANLGLKPETSHNLNVGPRVELKGKVGAVTADLNLFLRESRDMIVMLAGVTYAQYQNLLSARALGGEASLEWTSPGRWVTLGGGATYVDQRNTSGSGTFSPMKGDRVPNRPWLTAYWNAQLHVEKLLHPRDVLEPYYYARYVHAFYRGWESQGRRETKDVVPSQLVHGLGLLYRLDLAHGNMSVSSEIQNVSDARVFDLFGVQRPGRAYFLRVTTEL
jgi:vitamin B12 transporter